MGHSLSLHSRVKQNACDYQLILFSTQRGGLSALSSIHILGHLELWVLYRALSTIHLCIAYLLMGYVYWIVPPLIAPGFRCLRDTSFRWA